MSAFIKTTISLVRDFIRKIANAWLRFWHWYKGLYTNAPWYKKLGVGIVSCIAGFFILLVAIDLNLFWLFGKSPSFYDIKNPKVSTASIIYSADGKLIGKYFNQNRTPVSYNQISPIIRKALVCTEDERFYKHHGIDFQGLGAAVLDMFHGHARGASTITQQLAKNMFRTRSQYSKGLLGYVPGVGMFIVKMKEWITAVKLEMVYNKPDILTMYLNTVDFGNNAYGIKTAAKTYFNTDPSELDYLQSATLVGLLKATNYYNPISNPENSKRRRNTVLENMVKHDSLSRAEYEKLITMPTRISEFKMEDNYDGQALYFREAVSDYLKKWCADKGYDLYSSGLKIYTTIDTRMQKYAEQTVWQRMQIVQRSFNASRGTFRKGQDRGPWIDENGNVIPNFIENIARKSDTYKKLTANGKSDAEAIESMENDEHPVQVFDYKGKNHRKTLEISTMDSIRYMEYFMHASMVAMEPETGEVKAWVGDVDFGTWKYDKVTSMRQCGSTFKLFVYTQAMNQGMTPCDKMRDQSIQMMVYDKIKKQDVLWTPGNANGRFSGDSVSLRGAFSQSINSIAVQVGQRVGIDNIINTTHSMICTDFNGNTLPIDNEPSICLGAVDISLLQLANGYCTIANDGKQHDPVLVTKILDSDGNVVYDASTDVRKPIQAVTYRTSFLMQQMLKAGTDPGGTSTPLVSYLSRFTRDTDYGGKTGTTNNHSDAWYVGVTPKLVVGCWVGGEYRSIHFTSGGTGSGSVLALPIVGTFLQKVLGDSDFKQYRTKWGTAKEDIPMSCYSCAARYVQKKAEPDSVMDMDSTSVTYDDIMNAEGNTPSSEENVTDENGTGESTEGKHPKEKDKEQKPNDTPL